MPTSTSTSSAVSTITELRAVKTGSPVMVAHYDLPAQSDLFMAHAMKLNGEGYATYYTINPLRREVVNGLGQEPKTGAAARTEVIARIQWLPYDIDPDRPVGVCATDGEKSKARQIADALMMFWQARRDVEPRFVDSGNGFYVLVPVDLDVADESLIEQALQAHQKVYDIKDVAHIDNISDPPRVIRIPGTMNNKGEDTKERPWRRCMVLEPGSRDKVITAAELKDIFKIESRPVVAVKDCPEAAKKSAVEIEQFLEHCHIDSREKPGNAENPFIWVLPANENLCPNWSEHSDRDGDSSLAVLVKADGSKALSCKHSHCDGSGKATWKQFRAAQEKQHGAFAFGPQAAGPPEKTVLDSPRMDIPVEELAFKFVLSPREGEHRSAGAFPWAGISLIVGGSGACKSTWGYDMLEKQMRGEPVLGRATSGLKPLVLMHDRDELSLTRTWDRMRIKNAAFPFVTLKEDEENEPIDAILKKYIEKYRAQLVFVEGLDLWIGGELNKAERVAPLLNQIKRVARHYCVPIIGTVGTPKMKPREQYSQLRDRVIGTQAWSRKSETIVVLAVHVEDGKKGERKGDRDLHILTRDGEEQRELLRFGTSGRLEVAQPLPTKISEVEKTGAEQLAAWLDSRKMDEFEVKELGEHFDSVNHRTLQRWAAGLTKLGGKRAGRKGQRNHGCYKRVKS
jgi:hypothetical protein